MSGWQRIGVVISILWLIGVPIYLMVDQKEVEGQGLSELPRSASYRLHCQAN